LGAPFGSANQLPAENSFFVLKRYGMTSSTEITKRLFIHSEGTGTTFEMSKEGDDPGILLIMRDNPDSIELYMNSGDVLFMLEWLKEITGVE
jgi:hypothetical protein